MKSFNEFINENNQEDWDLEDITDIKDFTTDDIINDYFLMKDDFGEDDETVKKYKEELVVRSVNFNEPYIFQHTIYRIPTVEELKDVNSYNLSAKEIFNGFGYTIIGRGIKSEKNKKMIINSIKKLCNLYTDNKTYEESLELANKMLIKIYF
jgi:hypothetical protein